MDKVIDFCESLALSINDRTSQIPVLSSEVKAMSFNHSNLSSSDTLLSSINFHCQNNERVLVLDSRFIESDRPFAFNGDYVLVNFSVKSKLSTDRFIVLSANRFTLKMQQDIREGEQVIGLYLFDFSVDKKAQN